MLVFVYGTLMRGYPNHHLLSNSHYLGRARSRCKFVLLTDGIIPYLSRKAEACHVSGELYDVHELDLVAMDALESGYGRSEIHVELTDKTVYAATAYFKEDKKGVSAIQSGDYRDIDF